MTRRNRRRYHYTGIRWDRVLPLTGIILFTGGLAWIVIAILRTL